ncbi:OmpA family protein [Hansschlegelia zhihuaiae]|uniref:OmpA family protein n=2 Tax=Hansschlegelia zhihuaiae TaxID=405005 RepID=A0A4Q0ML94_9HYPH|nr:OmpA family protein [Hansschlegelia zhihuaiae]
MRDDRKEKREDAQEKREDRQEKREDARDQRQDDRQQDRVDRLKDRNQSLEDRIRDERKDARDDRDRLNDKIDRLKDQRKERRDGDRIIITEPGGRTIIRDGNRTIIRRDETARFRIGIDSRNIREERRNGEIRTVVTRPDGSRVVTVTDEDGRLIRRVREYRGQEYVLIDNRPRGGRGGVFVTLDIAPPRISIPRERYIVDADSASADDIEEAFTAPPVARLERSYSLDEIRQSEPLRQHVRSVDLDSIVFDTGSWEVRDDQIKKLENVGIAMEDAVKKDPKTVFMIEGHTDAVGSDDDNLSLSDRRAESVAEVLTKYFDIPAENLTTQGYGEQYLKVQTDGAEERNRRVTVRNITPLLSSSN